MKYSFMSFSAPDASLAELVGLAARLGYDGIEPRIDASHKHGVEVGISHDKCAEYKKIAADKGIAFSCVATSCRFADDTVLLSNIEYAKQVLWLANELGAGCIRVFGGQLSDPDNRPDAIFRVASALRELSGVAGDVKICMETHDSWCDPANVAAVMELCGCDNVRVNWDIMHPVLTANKTVAESFDIIGKWVSHVHIHDGTREGGKLTMLPIGSGKVDHKAALKCLLGSGYTGYISGEWINWSYPDHLAHELATLKRLEAELTR